MSIYAHIHLEKSVNDSMIIKYFNGLRYLDSLIKVIMHHKYASKNVGFWGVRGLKRIFEGKKNMGWG